MIRIVLALTTVLVLNLLNTSISHAEERTVNRSVVVNPFAHTLTQYGTTIPFHLKQKESHPAQWRNIKWNPEKWEEMGGSSDLALQNLFKSGVFKGTTVKAKRPVLNVGAMFFELSNLDRKRALELMVQNSGIFDNGYGSFDIFSTKHGYVVGKYTKHGLILR